MLVKWLLMLLTVLNECLYDGELEMHGRKNSTVYVSQLPVSCFILIAFEIKQTL